MLDASRKTTIRTDVLTTWSTPWMLITHDDTTHREAIAIDDRGTLLNAELPSGSAITDSRIEWVQCDPIRGGDPDFQAQARSELEAAARSTNPARSALERNVSGAIARGESDAIPGVDAPSSDD